MVKVSPQYTPRLGRRLHAVQNTAAGGGDSHVNHVRHAMAPGLPLRSRRDHGIGVEFRVPDCSGYGLDGALAPMDLEKKDLFIRIREIEADDTLLEKEKARRRQQLLGGKIEGDGDGNGNGEMGEEKDETPVDVLGVPGESFKCSYCMELPERPVTVLIFANDL